MRPKRLHELLKHSFQHRRRVLVKGKPGIGKSDIVDQVCAELGYDLLISHPAISDPTDYKGMPALKQDGSAEFVPFGDLNSLIQASKPVVCFLDDIGQAAPAVQAALMQLVLARRVNGHRISDQVVFCGATNDTGHMAAVSGMIEPLKSRWDTIVELEVSVDDWCLWALNAGMPAELVAFVRFRQNLLSEFKPTKELKNSPSPRGWASVGNWVLDGIKDLEVFTGAVGEGAATEFFAFLDMYASLPNLDGILLNPASAPVPDKPCELCAVASGLARKATPNNMDRLITYLDRLPQEFSVYCIQDAFRLNKMIAGTKAFITWAAKNSDVLL